MRTLRQLLDAGTTGQLWLAKKGRKYVTIRNGELALSTKQREAIAWPDCDELDDMFSTAFIDDRNNRFNTASFGFVPIDVPNQG